MGSVVDRLSEDRDDLVKANDAMPDRRKRAEADIVTFGPPAEATTNNTLTNIDAGNALKNSIFSIGGNVGLGSVNYGTSTSNITTKFGSAVVSVGTTTGNYTSITGIGSAQVVAFGKIITDVAKIYDYPNITNYNTDLVFDGEGFVNLTSSNVGKGVSTRVYQSGGSLLGLVFDTSTSDVSSLVSEYTSVWSKSADLADVATVSQDYHSEAQFALWGLNRQEKLNTIETDRLNTSIGIASNSAYGGPW